MSVRCLITIIRSITATMMTTPAITDSAMIAAKNEESTVFFSTTNVAQLK